MAKIIAFDQEAREAIRRGAGGRALRIVFQRLERIGAHRANRGEDADDGGAEKGGEGEYERAGTHAKAIPGPPF